MRIARPVVRSFTRPHVRRAAAWVRAGGHAIVWLAPRKARLVFPRPRDGDESDLGWWSVLDLGRSDYLIARRGPFAGLGLIAIPHDCYAIVRDRAVRDSIHAGPTRSIDLDCLECGACCRDNRVDGKVVLVLRRDKRCKHLADDNRCGVYPIRPDACSTFPAGSECCLSSREEELGIIDGATP
jgi:hypothetical protein